MRTKAGELNIWSFYRAPADLFAEMRAWREFLSGDDYSVDLRDTATGETVKVEYFEDWEDDYLTIKSDAPGDFFDCLVGRVVRMMSERNGFLKIRRTPYDDKLLFTPKFKRHFH